MGQRFKDMVKVPKEPVAKMLSLANIRLAVPIDAPVAALADEVLTELDKKGEMLEILQLLAVILPARERIWWACLAARDYIGPKSDKDPPSLAISEEWVFKPTEENRQRARDAIDEAYIDDDTVHIAMSVVYADGSLGPGELSNYPAPAGAAENFSFAMNVVALDKQSDRFEEYGQMLIDRAIDIARGGNGRVELGQVVEEAT